MFIDVHSYKIALNARRVSRLWTVLELLRHGDSWRYIKFIFLCFEMAESLSRPAVECYYFKVINLDVKLTMGALVMANNNFQLD